MESAIDGIRRFQKKKKFIVQDYEKDNVEKDNRLVAFLHTPLKEIYIVENQKQNLLEIYSQDQKYISLATSKLFLFDETILGVRNFLFGHRYFCQFHLLIFFKKNSIKSFDNNPIIEGQFSGFFLFFSSNNNFIVFVFHKIFGLLP
jgi:hypothetical protein